MDYSEGKRMRQDHCQIDDKECHRLLKEYSYLVKQIAYHLFNRLPANIQLGDLIQTGMIGLNEAIKTYDESKGASFTTYANLKIRGFIIDELRANEWLPRSVQENSRNIAAAIRRVQNRTGNEAMATEIAKELGVSLDEYHAMLTDLNASHSLDISDPANEIEIQELRTPLTTLQDQQIQKHVSKLIEKLNEREKIVLSLYYFEGFNFKEIGEILNITESRVSQIQSQALTRLKSRVEEW